MSAAHMCWSKSMSESRQRYAAKFPQNQQPIAS